MPWDNFQDPSYNGPYSGTPYPEFVEYVLDDSSYREVQAPRRREGSRIVFGEELSEEQIDAVSEALEEETGETYPTQLSLQKVEENVKRGTEIYEIVWH